MNLDDVWEMVGGDFGRFQKWSLVHWSVLGILYGMCGLSYVIISITPPYRCFVPGRDNDSSSFDQLMMINASGQSAEVGKCGLTSVDDVITSTNGSAASCNRWIYDTSEHVESVVTKWDLVCDRADLAPLTQTLMMLGVAFGSPVFGFISDRFGRKISSFVAVTLMSVAAIACTFVPPYSAFLVFRFMAGACAMGAYIASWSYVLEITGAKQRLLVCTLLNSSFTVGEVLVGLIGYFVHDWSVVHWIIAAIGILWAAVLCFFCESPRWLMAAKDFDKAMKAFEQIAKFNGREIATNSIKLDQLEKITLLNFAVFGLKLEKSATKREEQPRHYSALDLFRAPKIRWLTINLVFNWFAISMSYFGISMAFPSISGNASLSLIVVSLIEIPSYLFLLFVLDRFGRKGPQVALLILGGIAGLCTTLVALDPDLQWLFFCLILLAKFCCSCTFGNLFLYSNELFPTVMRTNGVGMCSLLGHLAASLSPYVVLLNAFHPALPLIIFGCVLLLSGLVTIALPETLNKPLPDEIEDLERNPGARVICSEFWRKLFRGSKGNFYVTS